MGDPFRTLEKALKALKDAEKKKNPKADWSDPAAKQDYIKRYKQKRRREILPPSRQCPVCKETIVKSRSWVILKVARMEGTGLKITRIKHGQVALCRSCAIMHVWKRKK